MGFELASGF